MGLFNKIVITGLMLGALAGCAKEPSSLKKEVFQETITGIPLSVQVGTARYSGSLSTILKSSSGRTPRPTTYLCSSKESGDLDNQFPRLIEAAALIESEINDGDEESIELRGHNNGTRFIFNYVKANGCSVDLGQ